MDRAGIPRWRALQPIAVVTLVVPDRPRSAFGPRSPVPPLRVTPIMLREDHRVRRNGTPSDCVAWRSETSWTSVRISSSRGSTGPNLGRDTYSGACGGGDGGRHPGTPALRSRWRPIGRSPLRPRRRFAGARVRILLHDALQSLLNGNVPAFPKRDRRGSRPRLPPPLSRAR